ncbi:transmembrane protease serine 11C-like [Python bivittatus]|uniref:Transmembrane protease serine 11C-like n=1 Tax=Python bivittatus TaxID=176946 RepID=A0A9F5IFL3_PYTBI|nr:transmembrane protease serine 11C-like [Python bivittatus]
MAAMVLVQLIHAPTHTGGYTLDLMFALGQWCCDLVLGGVNVSPLPWTDQSLLALEFSAVAPHHRKVGPIKSACLRCLMDPVWFQRELGVFPEALTCSSADALIVAWNEKVTGALNQIVPVHTLCVYGSHRAPWLIKQLREMKQHKRRLEHCRRKTKSKADKAEVKAYIRTNVVIRAAKLCGLRHNRSSGTSRITGGVSSGDWPWQASLQRNNIHRCGATLISNTWLLSAAHCFREAKNPHKWTVSFGTYLRPPLMIRLVKTIIIHEKYKHLDHEHDIAVLQLTKSVEFTSAIHRVCLPDSSEKIPYNIDAVVTGWGALSNDGETPNVLQEATVKLIDSRVCNRREVYNGAIKPGMICAGYLEGGIDSCQGDSGGPLMTFDSRKMWYLVGIVSWGDECAKPNKPGVYTRVTYYRDWITKYTGL